MNLLFVCSRNRLRSPTAEQVFADYPQVQTASAGLAPDADEPCSAEWIAWADLIFVMEPRHRARLQQRFGAAARGKRVVCLGIADNYDLLDPELITLLKQRVTPYLPVGDRGSLATPPPDPTALDEA